jgi:hypothetical protein
VRHASCCYALGECGPVESKAEQLYIAGQTGVSSGVVQIELFVKAVGVLYTG